MAIQGPQDDRTPVADVTAGVFATVVAVDVPDSADLVPGLFTLPGSGILIGVVLLAVAGVALVQSQPYHVWYPFGLMGLIMTSVMGGLFPVVRARYRQADERKMEAESLRRS